MRSIWSGGISFGLIYIPVRLYNASETTGIDFDMLDKHDLSPVGYVKVSKKTGKVVPNEDIVKGFEFKKGQYVIIEEEEFEQANVKKTKSIEIETFVNKEEIDPKFFEKPYFLEPFEDAKKTYFLLLEAMKKSGKVAVARFVLRTRERLAVIKAEENILVLDQMRFAHEMKDPKELNLKFDEKPDKEELTMAVKIIDQLTKEFKPEKYKDTYIEELEDMIKEKVVHKKISTRSQAPEPTKVVDLMAKLKASLKTAN